MLETFSKYLVYIVGGWLMFAGVWLSIFTLCDIGRSRRLMFKHAVQLTCAGSTIALGRWLVF